MTDQEIQHALHRIAFDGNIDNNSSRDSVPVLLEKIRAYVIGWNTNVRKSSEVVLCEGCKGKGTVERDELTDYHKREYDTWTEPCGQCGGSGRVKVTTLVRREPYQPLAPRGRH